MNIARKIILKLFLFLVIGIWEYLLFLKKERDYMRIRQHIGNVDIQLNTDRIDRNLKNAQKRLDEDVLKDTTPYVPKGGTEYLRGSGHIADGGGEVIWDANYAHYIYMGELYLAANGSAWAKKHEKKFPSGKPLTYQEPGAEEKFFEAAKRDHKEEWIADVKKEMRK